MSVAIEMLLLQSFSARALVLIQTLVSMLEGLTI